MKTISIAIIIFFCLGFITPIQDKISFDLDYKDPKSVVNAIFYAAQTKDFEILQFLCDPFEEGDQDTKMICSLTEVARQIDSYGGSEMTRKIVDEFVVIFESGRITGSVIYLNTGDDKTAAVPIWINHPGGQGRSEEEMNLVQRYGNWYLTSF